MNQKIVQTAHSSSFIHIFIENLCIPGTALETKSSKMGKCAPRPQVAYKLVIGNRAIH